MPSSTTDLDFFDIKANLKSFLRNQDEFADYDFEGSAMATLVDVLAYNTHYNAMTASMAVNEMFIDTAQVRNNVVSIAKSLGYTPISTRSAHAKIRLEGTSSSDNVYIPRGTIFKGGPDITFVTLVDNIVPVINGVMSVDLDLREGKLFSHRFTVGLGDDQSFELPNIQCDTTTIRVDVYNSSTDNTIRSFKFSDNIVDTVNEGNIFFIQENSNEKHAVYFGDDILGTRLEFDNIVEISYIKSKGAGGNNVSSFVLRSPISGLTSINITTLNKSDGGSNIESMESIKKNAPYVYTAQNRSVTAADFKAILLHHFSHLIKDVSVWGGENNDPPIYGKVFISAIPSSAEGALSDEAIREIKEGLNKYKLTSIVPDFINFEYIYLNLEIDYIFNGLKTNKSDTELNTLITQSIEAYDKDTLVNYNTVYYNSNIMEIVKNIDPAIIAVTVRHKASKDLLPHMGVAHKYVIKFNNSIYNPHYGHTSSTSGVIHSSGFKLSGSNNIYFLEDDGMSNILLYYHDSDGKKISKIVGDVDYEKGIIKTDDLIITSIEGGIGAKLLLEVQLKSYDVVPIGSDIITINSSVAKAMHHSNDQAAGLSSINYKTTPSRIVE